jgi:multidrug efflux pump subunit AcrA (membrane-fusion protein)
MPVDAEPIQFNKRRNGYDTAQVDACVAELLTRAETAEARLEEVESGVGSSVESERAIVKAKLEAIQIIASARDDAERVVREARVEAQAMVAAAGASRAFEDAESRLSQVVGAADALEGALLEIVHGALLKLEQARGPVQRPIVSTLPRELMRPFATGLPTRLQSALASVAARRGLGSDVEDDVLEPVLVAAR